MTRDSKLPKTNSLLPSINYKQFIALTILLLVTSSTTQSPSAKYDCPSGCECNETDLSARCDNLDELIASYSQKQHKSRHNFMPIKSLDLSNNQLTKLTNQLELLVNVTELNLSHNQLTQVHKLNFANLEKLDLSHNRITSAKLKKLPKNVVHLNLAHNEITYMPVDFMKLKKLRSLELAGNPLNCTCNTLHVRNWITYHHVWSDKTILCASPMTVKGQPWLQARQNDICIEPSSTTTQRSKYNWDNYENDNEIMMADQPQDDTDDVEYDEDEPEEDTPVEDEKPVEDETPADEDEAPADDDTPADDEKPSEDDSDKENKDIWKTDEKSEDNEDKPEDDDNDDDKKDEQLIPVSQEPEHDHDGSSVEPETVSQQAADEGSADGDEGSGGAPILSVSEAPEDEGEESGSGIPGLGIFDDGAESTEGTVVQKGSLTDVNAPENLTPGDVEKASQENNTGTYILLGILALCLVSLMAFVAMKNRKEKNRNRRYDVEKNGATELQDMDKSLLGKPLDRNGNGNGKAPEQAPLINDYPVQKEHRPATYASFQPPEITVDGPKAAPRDRSQQSLNGNGHVEPVHQTPTNGSVPKSPDSDDEIFHPANGSPEMPASLNVSPEPAKRYSPIYTSQSPRSDRYSPVYSPETGRVKIKLTETPKPKTPLVVTRSRSRAGDYVNTPN